MKSPELLVLAAVCLIGGAVAGRATADKPTAEAAPAAAPLLKVQEGLSFGQADVFIITDPATGRRYLALHGSSGSWAICPMTEESTSAY